MSHHRLLPFLTLALILALPAMALTVAPSIPNALSAHVVSTPQRAKRDRPRPAVAIARYPIKHIVIIDKENRSFDEILGRFPGADGATEARLADGKIIRLGHTPDHTLLDIAHAGDAAALAVNQGRMNQFNLLPGAIQDGQDIADSQLSPSDIPNYYRYAHHFTLDDHFFATIMGPSFPNHLVTIAASSANTVCGRELDGQADQRHHAGQGLEVDPHRAHRPSSDYHIHSTLSGIEVKLSTYKFAREMFLRLPGGNIATLIIGPSTPVRMGNGLHVSLSDFRVGDHIVVHARPDQQRALVYGAGTMRDLDLRPFTRQGGLITDVGQRNLALTVRFGHATLLVDVGKPLPFFPDETRSGARMVAPEGVR